MSSLKKQYGQQTGSDRILLSDMTDDGLPIGNPDMNIDGSITPVEFWIEPGPDRELVIVSQFSLLLSDGGTPGLDEYGNLPGLTNGIQFFSDFGGERELLGGPIKTNQNLTEAGGLFQEIPLQSADIRKYTFNFRALGSRGQFIYPGGKFGVIVRDDLTALNSHRVVVQGRGFPRVVPA